jgi:hypothetical protein
MGQLVLLPPGDGAPRPLRLRQGGLHEHPCQGGAVHTLTPPDPQLKGARYPGGFNPCAYEVKTWFQSLLFRMQLAPLRRGRYLRRGVPDRGHLPRAGRRGGGPAAR